MTPRMGTLVSLSAGALVGVVASFVPMVFGPLAFPEAISGPTPGEGIVVVSIPIFFFLFGAISFLITRKLVARFIDYGTDTNRIIGEIAPHPSESRLTEIRMAMVGGEKRERFWVTLGAAVLSFLFMAPADIVEVFYCLPKRLLDRFPFPSGSRLGTFVDLSWIAVGIGDRFYLPLALVLNIFLLFRKQAPIWLKVFLWILLLVALLGAVCVETEIGHIRYLGADSQSASSKSTNSTEGGWATPDRLKPPAWPIVAVCCMHCGPIPQLLGDEALPGGALRSSGQASPAPTDLASW